MEETRQAKTDAEAVTPAKQRSAPQTMRNGFAVAGLSLGIASVFLAQVGVVPILAIIFSSIGLGKAHRYGGRGRVQSSFGLALGILYTLVYLRAYGHI